MDTLFRICSFSFDNDVCPNVWRNSIITPIKKPGGKPRDPLDSLTSIPCKMYSEILNAIFLLLGFNVIRFWQRCIVKLTVFILCFLLQEIGNCRKIKLSAAILVLWNSSIV